MAVGRTLNLDRLRDAEDPRKRDRRRKMVRAGIDKVYRIANLQSAFNQVWRN